MDNNSYEHGANIYKFAKRASCKPYSIIDFSSNINCVQPSIDMNTIARSDITSYPDINYCGIKEIIKEHYKIDPLIYDIELFNGSTSAIYSFFRYIIPNKQKVTLYAPLYLEYKKVAGLLGLDTNLINRFTSLYKAVTLKSIVIFTNPSTPDGTLYDLEKLMDYWIENKCVILIDESFLDFTKIGSIINYPHIYKKLYILKSFTKFYACAGVRLGFIISIKENIRKLQSLEPPWKLSTFDTNYIIECLKAKDFPSISTKANEENKILLKKILLQSEIFSRVYPSSANFILAELKKENAFSLQSLLMPYLIYIRNCYNFDFLNSKFVRFAVKDKLSIRQLEKALNEIREKTL